jgi:short-subunit dehydrogenase
MKRKIFLIGGTSVIGNALLNEFKINDNSYQLIKITRNPEYSNNKDYIYIENYTLIDKVFKNYKSSGEDIIVLAFAYLGKTGYEENISSSLDEKNQQKVFDINLFNMYSALNSSIRFLRDLGGSIIYLSSAAAYPVRKSNIPYGLSKKFIDELLYESRSSFEKFKIKTLSVRIGFVDTPLNKGRNKTPFSSTPLKVSKSIYKSFKKGNKILYHPKSIYFVGKALNFFPRLSTYLDRKFS